MEAVVVLWGCSLGVAGDFLTDVALEVAFFLCCVVLVFDWAAFRDVFRVYLGILKPLLHFQRATKYTYVVLPISAMILYSVTSQQG